MSESVKMHRDFRFQQHSILSLLPDELIILIFSFMGPVTILQCRTICRRFKDIIDSDLNLVYKIELFADGMVNSEDCTHTSAQRLVLLRERRKAWKAMTTVLKRLSIGSQRWNAYELVDGIFAQTMNTLDEEHSSRGILFASLPSRHYEGSILKYDDVGFSFRDFAIDPTQNLVAFLQCTFADDVPMDEEEETTINVILRTMSTNKPHENGKSSAKETLTIIIPRFVHGAVIQIVDNVVGLMVWDDYNRSKMFMWNWMTGSLVVREDEGLRFDDFAFISNRAYVIAIPAPDSCFQVFTFDSSLEVSETNPTGTRLCATLYPPTPMSDAQVSIFGIHTGPFTTPNSPPRCFRPSKPFTTSSQSRIHVAHLSLASPPNSLSAEICLVVIHNKTFLKYIDLSERRQQSLSLTWEEWGINGTAWIPGRTGSSWLRYVHGERLARLYTTRTPSGNTVTYLEIYDFGIDRGPLAWIPRDDYYYNVFRSRHLTLDSVFPKQIRFRLPCRLIQMTETQPYSGFMIDEDRLIGIKVSNSREG